MRTTSIISQLRNNRRLNRRLKNSRIRYEDAFNALTAYQNSELKIDNVIDNKLTPSKSIANHCQLVGCGMKIRYEYVMKNKIDGTIKVVGSTCVWVLLEMSKEQIKEFVKIENSIKDYHDMIIWRNDNMDVWNKLEELKAADASYYKAFWEEVEFCRLHPEDEEYIRNVDVAYAIKRDQDYKAARFGRRTAVQNNLPETFKDVTTKNCESITGETDEGYKKVVETLKTLIEKNPKNDILKSMKLQEQNGKVLTLNQIHRIKVEALKDYYETKIKGTNEQIIYNDCDKKVVDTFQELVNKKEIRMYSEDLETLKDSKQVVHMIRKYKKQFSLELEKTNSKELNKLWGYFRIKHEIILK